MADMEFDFVKADDLKGTLTTEFKEIDAALKEIQGRVEKVGDWWTGGSEQGFIKNFKDTKNKVSKSLQEWLESYKKLIKEVSDEKTRQDNELKKALEQN